MYMVLKVYVHGCGYFILLFLKKKNLILNIERLKKSYCTLRRPLEFFFDGICLKGYQG